MIDENWQIMKNDILLIQMILICRWRKIYL